MNAVSCLTWIKRGVAKSNPDKVELDKEILRRIIEETKEEIKEHEDEENGEGTDEEAEVDAVADKKQTKGSPSEAGPSTSGEGSSSSNGKVTKRKLDDSDMNVDDADIIDKYGLDDYDDEDVYFQQGIGNLVYYADNDEDPYLSKDDPEDSDEEDSEIQATDNLLAVGCSQKDSCLLEFYVYDEPGNCLFVHHDIILPSFPLAVEWLDFDPSDDKPGNFVAVGSMAPTIDIWDVDLMNTLEPVMVLGNKKSQKKNKKKGSILGHTDSVIDLSWNQNARNVLSSASADCTVGLWDLSEAKAVASIRKHEDKVQCVNWHPAESQTLLTGGFDNTVRLFDCRDASYNHKTWNFGGEIEATVWNHFNPFYFYASTNTGHVYYTDVRQAKPVYSLSAHNTSTSCLALCPTVPELLLTASEDKTVKIWNVKENQPKLVVTKDMGLGGIMCVLPCPDSPFVFAIGGEKNMKVLDIRQSSEVREYFNTGESSGICLDGTKIDEKEDEEEMLVKRTSNLKIRKPRVKSKLDTKQKKIKKKKKPNSE